MALSAASRYSRNFSRSLFRPYSASRYHFTEGKCVPVTIDGETVDHVALLARLALTTSERERLREQLSAILEHINVMNEADTSQVPATAHILPLENVMRPDRAEPWLQVRELIENAPSHEASYIRVRSLRE